MSARSEQSAATHWACVWSRVEKKVCSSGGCCREAGTVERVELTADGMDVTAEFDPVSRGCSAPSSDSDLGFSQTNILLNPHIRWRSDLKVKHSALLEQFCCDLIFRWQMLASNTLVFLDRMSDRRCWIELSF
eukprot:5471775-Amphidinium_carterae.1